MPTTAKDKSHKLNPCLPRRLKGSKEKAGIRNWSQDLNPSTPVCVLTQAVSEPLHQMPAAIITNHNKNNHQLPTLTYSVPVCINT